MNVLILGGTQFFGKEIVRFLSEGGHTVGVLTRGNKKLEDLPSVQHIQGNRENPADLARANDVEKWDAVIDNIAYNAEHVRAALKAFSKTSHYILTSSIAVYRFIPKRFPSPMKEGDVSYEYQPPNEDLNDVHWKYARGKLEAERECVRQRKIPYTIVRPSVVYGPNDPLERGAWYLIRLLRGGPLLLSDGGVQSCRLTYSVDLGRAYAQIVENRKKVSRKTYFIAQDEIITLRDFVELSAHVLGIVPDWMDIPHDVLGDLGGPLGNLVNLIPDLSAARKDFGYVATPFGEFVRTTAEWFRDHWRGDEKKLLTGREKENELAVKWKKLIATKS